MKPSEAWRLIRHAQETGGLDLMATNERLGAALAFIYREAPEWKQRVADYLADYPFTFGAHNDGSSDG